MYEDIAEHYKPGAVVVLPTDTVYGLTARVSDQVAVKKLYALKSREHKPGTVIAASIAQLTEMGLSLADLQQAGRFWPAPISVVTPTPPSLQYLDQSVGSIAVRIPDDPSLRDLLQITGPLVTSSANDPGMPPANTIAEAKAYFNDKVDFYVDGGDLSGNKSSTVIRFNNGKLEVLRQGAVNITPEAN